VLTDVSYRARAEEVRAEMHTLPGAAHMVGLLTGLARDRVPAHA
jgi:UDP:flavonoid glycosyltransferase YjiC (YdhE family)